MGSTSVSDDVSFIETDLVPEMVHNRCFCEAGSREFVELESVKVEVEPVKREALLASYPRRLLGYSLYRTTVVVQFSGEPQEFHVLVKLLTPGDYESLAYDAFLNEEILWNKATLQYNDLKRFMPRFYVADMGKYGRPVVVVEDLEKNGFERVLDRLLSRDEAILVAQFASLFHGRGFELKQNEFSVFREFQAKFQEITFAQSIEQETRTRFDEYVGLLRSEIKDDVAKQRILNDLLGDDPYARCKEAALKELSNNSEVTSTICQGLLVRENLWFRKVNSTTEVRVFDWQRIRCGLHWLDLATILAECERDWQDVLKAYAEPLQPNTEEELCGSTGLPYALLVSSLEDRHWQPMLANLLNFVRVPAR